MSDGPKLLTSGDEEKDAAPKVGLLDSSPPLKVAIVIEGEVSEEFLATFGNERLFHKYMEAYVNRRAFPHGILKLSLRTFDIIPDECPMIGCLLSEYHSGEHEYPKGSSMRR